MARLAGNIMTDALMLVGGGVVGAGVALLLAPHSGRRTRREIARMGKTIGTKGDRAVREVARKANELADTVGEKVGAVVREGKDMVSEGKKEFLATVEKGGAKLASRRFGMARDVS